MKIAFISTQLGWYGGERQLALLAAGLRRRGHHCAVAARDDGSLASRLSHEGFEVLRIHGRGRSPLCLWRMRGWLRRFRPDVIHYNDSHALTSGGIAAQGLGIPLRVASRRVDFPIQSNFRLRYLTDVVVCVSNAVRDACLRVGMPSERLRVVHDGIDPDAIGRTHDNSIRYELGIGNGTKLLLTVAKLAESKGHRFLLDALPRVIEAVPNLLLICAGDGPLWPALENRVRQLGIARHVRFLGFRTDIANLLSAADLMVIPSHTEGLCSSIIEAMFVGCPVAASRVGGIPDLLADAESSHGWLFPPRDSVAIATTISEALRSEYQRVSRAARAQAFARENLTAELMIDRTLAAYGTSSTTRSARSFSFRRTKETSIAHWLRDYTATGEDRNSRLSRSERRL